MKTKKITKGKSVRLESYISPIYYNLTLTPDLESFTFSGKEVIKIKIDKDVKQITLHSKDLDIETVKHINKSVEQFAEKITYDKARETATFYFKNTIKKGTSELSIIFSGIIGDNLRGFYKSKYSIDGKEKYLATTQFESTDARRAFPCFDEPAHKAVFEVSLIIKSNHTAISNTLPINIKEHSAGYKVVSFAPTPIMSTYLLAFIVGEFEYVEGFANKTQIRVFTTPNKKHQAKFALDVAIKSLLFFNKYFDIPYPLPTLDLIAIPDFEAGAMENWGAITFRETAILVDEENSSLSNKEWVAIVIAHEIAHQWFGNLVTMHWWTDLWLNEGFASYMENLCIDKIFPHWHVWNLFLADRYTLAQGLDALKNSHPIEIEVNHPNEISEIFDMVSYAKGSAIIRMLAGYIGEDKFQKGVQYYLKKHSYKNTKTMDLWESFEKSSGKPVKKIMNTWTKQAGYPLVSITSHKSDLWLAQERFFSSRVIRKENKEKNLWQIPVIYNSQNNKESKILLEKKNIKLGQKNIGKINVRESSFIRVNYDKKTLEFLKQKIKGGRMSTVDRLGIVRDIFALAEGGYIKASEALDFSLSFKNEQEFIVWSELASGINKIYNLISDEDFAISYKSYALSLFSSMTEIVGFNKKENEKHSDTLLRNLILSQSAFYGDKDVIKKAKQIFANRGTKRIDSDIRDVVYNIVARNGGEKEWKTFEQLYKKETLHEEKDRYARAMTRFSNEKLLKKTLDFSLSKEVKEQDTPFIIASTLNNKVGRDIAWQFLKNNWGVILKRYGESGFLTKLLPPLGNYTQIKYLKDIKNFFRKNSAPSAERTLNQIYEKINSNIAWLKDDKKDIRDWLEKNY